MRDHRQKQLGKRINREVEGESCALLGLTRGPDAAAVQVHQFSCDVKAQAKARAVAIDRFRVLIQTLKNEGEGFRGNTTAGIANCDVNKFGIGFLLAKFYVYRSFEWRELDRI